MTMSEKIFTATGIETMVNEEYDRQLILENRWPEEEYISDVKFMEG